LRFAFTEQQLELRAAVHQVLERECTPGDLRAIVASGPAGRPGHPAAGRSTERWAVLSELGAPGLMVATDRGGLGLSEVDFVGVAEEAGWAGLPEPLIESAALAAPLLAGADPQVAGGSAGFEVVGSSLASMATGDLVATVGGVELTAGGLAPTTNGGGARSAAAETPRVTGATRAGLYLLARRVPGEGWCVHAVEDVAGVTATPSIDGTRDLGTVEWVPSADTVVASGAHAEGLLAEMADRAALFAAAQLLGLSARILAMAADYAKERKQFGKPIGSFQAVKHLLAGARVRLEFAAPATYRAADSLARQLPQRSAHVSMAKSLASDAADMAARAALQVHGAIGYTWECDLHLYMKRAWALSAAWGDAATHRARVLDAALASPTHSIG
jgi:alkylation response protein AidB-like acyl-CoA dehydrogenase